MSQYCFRNTQLGDSLSGVKFCVVEPACDFQNLQQGLRIKQLRESLPYVGAIKTIPHWKSEQFLVAVDP